ncbi:hypothetical protein LCGC14_0389370 [marine sediment metagenome]|uniref:Uncharacterized protein n=1 Tax=marine sediment metagenome TaxID=412755 RepID=A0A0F9SZZ5_9ZZZZ
MVEIDKGIPLKEENPKAGARKYPYDQMVVGDSFFSKRSLASSTKLAEKRTGFIFTQRAVARGYRIWRTH